MEIVSSCPLDRPPYVDSNGAKHPIIRFSYVPSCVKSTLHDAISRIGALGYSVENLGSSLPAVNPDVLIRIDFRDKDKGKYNSALFCLGTDLVGLMPHVDELALEKSLDQAFVTNEGTRSPANIRDAARRNRSLLFD